jgi:hypothetical protein
MLLLRPLVTKVLAGRNSAGLATLPSKRQVPIDLVRDDEEAVRLGDLGDGTHHVRRGNGARGIVGQRDDQHAGTETREPCGDEALGEQRRIGHASGGADRDRPDALADEGGLGGVAHPRGTGQHDVARQHPQQREEQSLAPRREDDLVGVRRQPVASEIAGCRLASRSRARYGTVGVLGGRVREDVANAGKHRQPGFAEGEVNDGGTRRDLPPNALVGSERRRRLDDRQDVRRSGCGRRRHSAPGALDHERSRNSNLARASEAPRQENLMETTLTAPYAATVSAGERLGRSDA